MEIRRTRPEERDQILDLYAHASALQRSERSGDLAAD